MCPDKITPQTINIKVSLIEIMSLIGNKASSNKLKIITMKKCKQLGFVLIYTKTVKLILFFICSAKHTSLFALFRLIEVEPKIEKKLSDKTSLGHVSTIKNEFSSVLLNKDIISDNFDNTGRN